MFSLYFFWAEFKTKPEWICIDFMSQHLLMYFLHINREIRFLVFVFSKNRNCLAKLRMKKLMKIASIETTVIHGELPNQQTIVVWLKFTRWPKNSFSFSFSKFLISKHWFVLSEIKNSFRTITGRTFELYKKWTS
jgi:hypothetical protein